MTTDELLNELEHRGIWLAPYRGGLRATGKTVNLTKELKIELAQHKVELMAQLGAAHTPPLTVKDQLLDAIGSAVLGTDLEAVVEQAETAQVRGHMSREDVEHVAQVAHERSRQIPYGVEDMPLPEFADSGLACEVHSHLLGEDVLFAADNAQIPADNSLVVYRAAERQKLVGAPPEMLKAVHTVKEQLDGVVVEPVTDAVEIPAAMLLKSRTKPSRCHSCGQDRWWRQNGRRICRVCHPTPSKVERSATTGHSRSQRDELRKW
jgi:hypothetical protein